MLDAEVSLFSLQDFHGRLCHSARFPHLVGLFRPLMSQLSCSPSREAVQIYTIQLDLQQGSQRFWLAIEVFAKQVKWCGCNLRMSFKSIELRWMEIWKSQG